MKKLLFSLVCPLIIFSSVLAINGEIILNFPNNKTIAGTSDNYHFFHIFSVNGKQVGGYVIPGDGKINLPLKEDLKENDEITVQVFNHDEKKIYDKAFIYTTGTVNAKAKDPATSKINNETNPAVTAEPAKPKSNLPLIIMGGLVIILLVGGVVFVIKRKRDLNNYE